MSAGVVHLIDKNLDTPPATPPETPAQIIPIDPSELDAFALATRQAKEALVSDAYVNRVVEFVCKGSTYRFRLLRDPSDSSCCIAPDLGSETPQALLAHVVNLAGDQSKVSIDARTINGKSAFERLAPPPYEPIAN